ncbi:peptidylprolyl isomerase [Frankia sp. AgB1.9]|uniref:peptidylprolyl isomerase n=1 Tax=unclassified Frankia TaxID=2632575 RepID=UPI001932B2F0|nr:MULTISPECIES: peptidylprolyl isomerase [unclassified Frankia]MBL7491260.1 peptidylprolyl isomerase [Frankia sp. AgW1.1]MBL7547754.1 peptidylprolyl isomerase [Frankia sp. AgB1.9]MBL7621290.1 peptidylprolyl isomerase [Frankia sp. AgB1.8]
MPDEKDPAGPNERPAESSAPAEPAAKTSTAPPIIVSAAGIPMIPGVGTADALPGGWAGLLPPPRDPAAGPWSATGPTLRDGATDDEDDDARDEDDDLDAAAKDLGANDLDTEIDDDPDAKDLDTENPDAEDFDEPDPADFDDDEDDEDEEDDDEAKPSWQKDISAGTPRRRQLSPEVKVAAFGLLAAALLITGAVLISKAVGGSSSSADTLATLPTPTTKPLASTKVGDCVYTEDGQQPARDVTLPPAGPSVDTKTATMTLNTNYGTMVATLDAAKAPCTVHALEYLAQHKFYDQTTCHRETSGSTSEIFVLQCGDPTAQGSGTPGFAYKNENTSGVNYNRGVLAMANGGPDTNGSQFFISYADPTEAGAQALAGGYTVFGQITQGLDVLDKITSPGVQGETGDGAPASKPEITSVTITQ